jgi:hypothetical protein
MGWARQGIRAGAQSCGRARPRPRPAPLLMRWPFWMPSTSPRQATAPYRSSATGALTLGCCAAYIFPRSRTRSTFPSRRRQALLLLCIAPLLLALRRRPSLVALCRAAREKTKAAETTSRHRRLGGLRRVIAIGVRHAAPSRTVGAETSAPKGVTAEPKVLPSTSSCALTNTMAMRPYSSRTPPTPTLGCCCSSTTTPGRCRAHRHRTQRGEIGPRQDVTTTRRSPSSRRC